MTEFLFGKTLLPSSVCHQVVVCCVRGNNINDLVFVKENSIELVAIGKEGELQSIGQHFTFGTLKNVVVCKSEHAQKDLLLLTGNSGCITAIQWNPLVRKKGQLCFEVLDFVRIGRVGLDRTQAGHLVKCLSVTNSKFSFTNLLATTSLEGSIVVIPIWWNEQQTEVFLKSKTVHFVDTTMKIWDIQWFDENTDSVKLSLLGYR